MRLNRAIELSAAIMVSLRFHLSNHTPMKGPRIACGRKPTNPAIVSTTADSVVAVKCQMIANCTMELVSIEKICPENRIVNVFFQLVAIKNHPFVYTLREK